MIGYDELQHAIQFLRVIAQSPGDGSGYERALAQEEIDEQMMVEALTEMATVTKPRGADVPHPEYVRGALDGLLLGVRAARLERRSERVAPQRRSRHRRHRPGR